MAIELKAGQVVLVNAGIHGSTVSLMRVYGDPTPRKVRGQSWDASERDWNVAVYGRNRDAVVAVVADGVDPAAVYQQLQDAAVVAHEERKRNGQRYKDRVQEIARGEFGITEAASQPREGEVEILRRALAWHGDPARMATTREEWQQTIDAAILWVKANPEPDRLSFSSFTQRPPEQAGAVPAGWQPIETAPRDGTTFIGRNADHHSFGSWPMQRLVRHVFETGEAKCLDGGGWLIVNDHEPDFDGGLDSLAQVHVPFSIATDDLNKTVRYEWQPLPSAAPTPPDAGPGEIPAGMVEAAKPFVRLLRWYDAKVADDVLIAGNAEGVGQPTTVTVGDLRRLAEALTPKAPPQTPPDAGRHVVSIDDSLAFADMISEKHRLRANEAEARIASALNGFIQPGETWQAYALRLRAALSTETPPDAGSGSDGAGDGTALGEVQCHCSEDDGIPDVGVSIGLGNGRVLWLGELLTRDGGDIGLVFHGPEGLRIAAPLWPNCEWQEAADILLHHVGPALATQPGDGGRKTEQENQS